jgi:polar amino acid transport system substrate-binding protein
VRAIERRRREEARFMIRKRSLAVLAPIVLAAVAMAGCGSDTTTENSSVTIARDPKLQALLPDEIRDRGTIRVATDMGYAPFEYFGANRKPVGLDIDLMRALEPILGVTFEITDTTYAGIIPALQAKRYDVGWSAIVLASLGGTGTVDFLVYIDPAIDSLLVSSSNASIKEPSDLCGKTFGFLHAEKSESADLASARCTSEGKPEVMWRFFQKTPDVILAVESGQVDARVAHVVNGAYYVKASKGKLKLVKNVLPKSPLTMGVAVPVGETGLKLALRGGLERLIANGRYGRILARYGAASVGVRRITVRR